MDIADQFMQFPGGSLCIFGAWFGKPMDNCHIPVYALYEGGVLEVGFNEDEVLEVGLPSELHLEGKTLVIEKADWINWAWYSYGMPKTLENKFFYKYESNNGVVTSTTNSPWPSSPQAGSPALQIC